MFPNFLLSIFLFLCLDISAQTFQSKLLDVNTHENIGDAFVFISNSSISTTSDTDGIFTIDRSALPNSDIVISHINYETKYLLSTDLKEPLDTVYLNPTTHALDEVVLKSKGLRKRKKWLKRFTRSLLGTTKNADQSKLVNPDAVLFQEKQGLLTAITDDHLIFKNEKLGYNLWFLLEEYSLEKNDDVLYAGKVFFENFEEVSDIHLANRKEVFEKSSKKFFKDYVSGTYDTLQYTVALATLEGNGVFHYVGEMKRKNLISSNNENELVELKCHRFLRIEDKTIFANQKNNKTLSGFGNVSVSDIVSKKGQSQKDHSDYAVSYLKSKTKKIIVNREGIIQNQKDIEEYGYWSELRLADRLPDDFVYVPIKE